MKSKTLLNTFIAATFLAAFGGVTEGYAQNSSALATSGMGGGASSTARLTAQMAQVKDRADAVEACGNGGYVYGPSHGNIDGNGCIRNLNLANGGNSNFFGTLGVSSNAGVLNLIGTDHAYIQYYPDGQGAGRKAYLGYGSGASDTFTIANEVAGGHLGINTEGAQRMIIANDGEIGINLSNPQHLLHVNGNGRFNNNLQIGGTLITTGASTFNSAMSINSNLTVSNNVTANAFFYSSDRTLKKNIEPVKGGVDLVSKLEPVYFDWKANDEASIGFIAQDVREVVPAAVQETPNGTLAVDYGKLVAPLVAAVNEQQKQIDALKAEVKSLRSKLDK